MPDPKWSSLGGQRYYPQSAWDADPGSPAPVQVPLAGEAQVSPTQAPIEADIFMEDREPAGMVLGRIDAKCNVPLGMEFVFIGYLLRDLLMTYSHISGTGLHRFMTALGQRYFATQTNMRARPGGTDLFARLLSCLTSSIKWDMPDEGPVKPTWQFTGSGYETLTDLGGTVENNGYTPMSAFWGKVFKDDVDVTDDMTKFSLELYCDVADQRGPMSDGRAKMIAAGPIKVRGDLNLLVRDDLDYYTQAINAQRSTLDIYLCDNTPAYCDQWLRLSISRGLFSRKRGNVGTVAGLAVEQMYQAERAQSSADGFPAENFATIRGPYNIVASTNDAWKVAIDGGGDLGPFVLTPGAARTAEQVVADYNAAAGVAAVATGKVINGRPWLISKTKGTGSSVTFKTTANSAYATLGLDTTARTGQAQAGVKAELYSKKTTDYD